MKCAAVSLLTINTHINLSLKSVYEREQKNKKAETEEPTQMKWTHIHIHVLTEEHQRRAQFSISQWLLAIVFQWFLFRGVSQLDFCLFFVHFWNRCYFWCVKNWCWYEYCYYCTHMAFECFTNVLLLSSSIKILCVYAVQYSCDSQLARRINSVTS